jgi:hypothetical protein
VALAQAADAGTRVAARELAVAGAEAYDKQDYAAALDRFQRAEQLYKVPSITVMVARCLAGNGRLVEAVDKYEETLRMPLDAAAPEAFQRAVSDAASEVETTRARVARLELHLPADAPPGTQVFVDDRPVPPALIGVPTPVDPGTHRVRARAPGKVPYVLELSLTEGGLQVVRVELAAAPRPANDAPVSPASRELRPSALSIGLLAGGGVALAVGTVTGIAALNHQSALEDGCTPGCPPSLRNDLDGFRRNRTFSYVGLGVGLVAAGTGAFLLWHESSSGRHVGAAAYPGGAFVTGRF